jgi:ATP-dependent DNA helicase RecG
MTIDGDDRKLIRHLQRNGRITNADVRDYLDCDVYLARDRLTRLRKRGWIDFLPGGPTRGPDVVYVKTDKFDAQTV